MPFRKGISDADYSELAKSKQSVLNTANLPQDRIIERNNYFVLFNQEDEFKYSNFDGNKIEEHYLIIPIDDDFEPSHAVKLEEKALFDIIETASKLHRLEHFIFWKSRGGRSVKKWHGHVLFIAL